MHGPAPSAPAVSSALAVPSAPAVPYVVTESQHTQPPQTGPKNKPYGLLFAHGFNDRLLLRDGQLEHWKHYLQDNPRRLLMKREHPDLFRVQRGLVAAGQQFSAIGNRFLLDRPVIRYHCRPISNRLGI